MRAQMVIATFLGTLREVEIEQLIDGGRAFLADTILCPHACLTAASLSAYFVSSFLIPFGTAENQLPLSVIWCLSALTARLSDNTKLSCNSVSKKMFIFKKVSNFGDDGMLRSFAVLPA